MIGDLVYVELPLNLDKLDETFAFYQTFFGWKIQESFLLNQRYFIFETPGKKFYGGFDSSIKPHQDGINFYIHVDSIEDILNRIKKDYQHLPILRGKTLISKEDGSYALITDPSGNKIGINEYPKD